MKPGEAQRARRSTKRALGSYESRSSGQPVSSVSLNRCTAAMRPRLCKGEVMGMRHTILAGLLAFAGGCGDDGATEADRLGVGAQCTASAECDTVGELELECLTQFAGGYCGLAGCEGDADCPQGSACVTHDDGNNYCFRVCADKPDCNRNRSPENEANCVGSIAFVDPRNERKACEPPSSGL